MRRVLQNGPSLTSDAALALFVAIMLHVVILGVLLSISTPSAPMHLPLSLSVVVIEAVDEDETVGPNLEQEPRAKQATVQPKPRPISNPIPAARSETVPNPEPEPQQNVPREELSQDEIRPPITIIQNDSVKSEPDENESNISHIPSRWALKPPLATRRLEGLGFSHADIKCLTSLDPECQDLRKEVFVEYLLTETELIWTPNRPDTAMPAEFRGLSKQEILEKLGMNYAGGNALLILPGIAIDGPLWDRLHGVNKPCRLERAITGPGSEGAGGIGVRRVCD